MPRLQQLDPSGLRVVILKGEVVFRCHDLPLVFVAGEKILSGHTFVRPKLASSDFDL